MNVSITGLHIFRILTQLQTNLVQLQRDMHHNAAAAVSAATAQSAPLTTLQNGITSSIGEYNRRLGWVAVLQSDSTNWLKVSAMYAALGGGATDIEQLAAALKTAIITLSTADVSTYAAVAAAGNALISAVSLPLSLWPE